MRFKKDFKLMEHQKNIKDIVFLYWDTGTGKTYGAINYALERGYDNILFVTLASNRNNVKNQLNNVLEDVTITDHGNVLDIKNNKNNIFIISPQYISYNGIEEILKKLDNCFVIFDEFHKYLNSEKSKIYKYLINKQPKVTKLSKNKLTNNKNIESFDVLSKLKNNCMFASATTITNKVGCIGLAMNLYGKFFKCETLFGSKIDIGVNDNKFKLIDFNEFFLKKQYLANTNSLLFSDEFKSDKHKEIFYENLYEYSHRSLLYDVVGKDNHININYHLYETKLDDELYKIQKSLKENKLLEINDKTTLVGLQEKISLLRGLTGVIYFETIKYDVNDLIDDPDLTKRVSKVITYDLLKKDIEIIRLLESFNFSKDKVLMTTFNKKSADRLFNILKNNFKEKIKIFKFDKNEDLIKTHDVCVGTMDAMGTGIDSFKVCNKLINYQIDSSVSKRTQLIGRLTRIGSPHKEIDVYDMMYIDSIERNFWKVLNGRKETIELYQEFINNI